MHNLYIAEIYRPGTILLPPVVWVYLHSLLHIEPQNKLYRCYGRSRSFKVIEIGNNQ